LALTGADVDVASAVDDVGGGRWAAGLCAALKKKYGKTRHVKLDRKQIEGVL
jgi:hypothetical protein